MLQSFSLEEYCPDSWVRSNCTYADDLFKKYILPSGSQEYKDVKTILPEAVANKLRSIQRVQHPLGFLRYRLQSEFLLSEGRASIEEELCCHVVSENDAIVALRHNCDHRRYTTAYQEYSNTQSVICNSRQVIIIMKRRKDLFCTDNTRNDRDQFPIYIVSVH